MKRLIMGACVALTLVAGTATVAVAQAVTPVAITAPATEPSFWDSLFVAVREPLLTLVAAVLAWIGTVIAMKVKSMLGNQASIVATTLYNQGKEAAVDWLEAQLDTLGHIGPVTINTPQASEAAEYMQTSYPKAAEQEPNFLTMVTDIVASFNKRKSDKKK